MSKPDTVTLSPEAIPQPLKALRRWVLWRWELRKGKWTKPPKQADDKFASTSDSRTWCSYDEAIQAYVEKEFDGVGIVLPEGIVGVDLDDCVSGSDLTESAKMLLAMLPGTYAEVSPSGTGLKLLCAGQLNSKLAKTCIKKGIELYDGGDTNRYFTLTGQVVEDRRDIYAGRDGLHAIQSLITEPITDLSLEPEGQSKDKALELLKHISKDRAEDYHDWLKVGMSLSWADKSDDTMEAWIEWSSDSAKFDRDICVAKWESFKREDGRLLTVGHLEKLARADGYAPNRYQTQSINAADLWTKIITRDYLIDDILVKNEPMIIGGPSKALKTSIALDMAISIATGSKFLGKWDVKEPRSVMFISGESGESTLQENLRAMATSKGLGPSDLKRLDIGFRLPKLDALDCVEDLLAELKAKEISVVFIDPLYRSLRVGENASNVYAMGEQLELIAEKIHRAGLTTILLHHFRKQGRNYSEPPELEDLSQSGVAEFGRQFILLKRKSSYEYDGKHGLWFSWGGSAGHQGSGVLDVFTGTRSTGLTWQITYRTEREWKAYQDDIKAMEKEGKEETLRERILSVIGENPGIKTQELIGQIGGKDQAIRELLKVLEYEMEVHSEGGAKNAKHWHRNEK